MQCWLWYIGYSIPVSNYLKPFFWFDFGAIGKPCRTLNAILTLQPMNSLSLCMMAASPPQCFINSLLGCSLQHLVMRNHLLDINNQKILYLVMDIVLGSAVNDKQSIIVIANDEEHYSDSDLAHNSPSFFFKVHKQYCNRKQYFSNFCAV